MIYINLTKLGFGLWTWRGFVFIFPGLLSLFFPLLVGILGFLFFLFWVLFWRVDVRYLERRYYYYQNMALFLDFIFHTIKLVQPFCFCEWFWDERQNLWGEKVENILWYTWCIMHLVWGDGNTVSTTWLPYDMRLVLIQNEGSCLSEDMGFVFSFYNLCIRDLYYEGVKYDTSYWSMGLTTSLSLNVRIKNGINKSFETSL